MSKKKYNPDYGFLAEYDTDMEEAELESLFRKKKIRGQYRTDTIKAGDQLALNIYPAFAAWDFVQRKKKMQETREAQKAVNQKHAKRKLQMLCAENFGENDFWMTLTFRDEDKPETYEDAKRMWRNYLIRIRRERKKQGLPPLKYIAVLEMGTERPHFHCIVSGDMSRDDYETLWGYGERNQVRRIDPDPDTHMAGIVEYISKDPRGSKRWFQSKGLKKPAITTSLKKFSRRKVARMVLNHDDLCQAVSIAHPDYKFVDSEVRINPYNGGAYIYVRMTRVNKKKTGWIGRKVFHNKP